MCDSHQPLNGTDSQPPSIWTDGHSFQEDESRSRFLQHRPQWVSNCLVCGVVGYLTQRGWRHKPLRKVYREYRERDSRKVAQ